jgi:Trk K+ transport system NAD-binding subunit
MKLFPSQLYYFLRHRPSRVNVMNLVRFLVILTALVLTYSVLFHLIMAWEGQTEHSWATGFYWTLTVMSTLGFGDITFNSDLGRIFSTVVLLSGMIFLLILLPFTFIEFFYAPWMAAQAAARAPNELPEKASGHVILTEFDAVTRALIGKIVQYHYPYVLLVPDVTEALRLHDLGYRVVVGDLDNPQTYRRVRVENALLVVTTANDRVNTNVAFTVREISEHVPIVATANSPASVDILQLAGSSHVFQLGEMMGQALARRVMGGDSLAHVIGRFDRLLIAEAIAAKSALVGQTLRQSRLREQAGISVLGVWERGIFQTADPETRITPGTVLVLAGTETDIRRYNELFHERPANEAPVIIIGGGRVGRAAGQTLAERGLDYRIVEQSPERIRDPEKYILGDAADLEVLERAGIMTTSTVVVTTHDDDTNIYLTIYCHRLRSNIQIISRASLERNVATLHRAGADFVMSYASMGANTIVNLLSRSHIMMVAEGLDIFEVKVPPELAGKAIAEADVRRETGCTIIALDTPQGMQINPDPAERLPAGADMILIGTVQSENRFLKLYGPNGD